MNYEIKTLSGELSQLLDEKKELENDLFNLKKEFQQMTITVKELGFSLETLNKSFLDTSKCIPKKDEEVNYDPDEESEHESVILK